MIAPSVVLAPQLLQKLRSNKQPLSCTNLVGENVRKSGTPENRRHQGIGYVTPNDEHEGRGEAIRKARQAGLEQARLRRLAAHRRDRQTQPIQDPDDVG
jgi:hypothetical protein